MLIVATLYKLKSAMAERDFDPASVMHDQDNLREQTFAEGGYTQEALGFLAKPFRHHANFLSLTTIRTYDTLAKHRWITVVDGHIPLVDFFVRFSRPGNSLKTVLLIPLALQKWVPKIWADNVMYYELMGQDRASSVAVNKKLFISVIDSGLNTSDQVAQEFELFKQSEPSDAPIWLALHAPNAPLIPHPSEAPYEHIKKLLKKMRDIDSFICPDKIMDLPDPSTCTYYFCKNFKCIRYYSEFEQSLLSKKFIPFDSYKEMKNDERKPDFEMLISAHHTLNIFDLPAIDNDELWNKINYDVSNLGIVDNIIGQDLSKVLIEM